MTHRLIVCLDVNGKTVVKGTKFKQLTQVGCLYKLAYKYYKEGADEIIILNITKKPVSYMTRILKRTVKHIFIPIIYGGNITSFKDIELLFKTGIDKICLNSTLYYNPKLIKAITQKYGTQSVIASIDIKKTNNQYHVFINGGKTPLKTNLNTWLLNIKRYRIGELLITSINKDGKRQGYDLKLIHTIEQYSKLPIIASGGMGKKEDIIQLFKHTQATGALIASFLHIKHNSLKLLRTQLKPHLKLRQ